MFFELATFLLTKGIVLFKIKLTTIFHVV